MALALVCGDPHGQFSHIVEEALQCRPNAVFLLGDMDAKRPLELELQPLVGMTEIHWIPGNHDTDSECHYDHVFGSSLSIGNLHGRVVTVEGLRVAGLGGVFRKKIWDGATARFDSPEVFCRACGKGNLWRGGLPLKHRSSLFPSHLANLQGSTADVLLTHEAPNMHRFGYSVVTDLAEALGVRFAFHGHHHEDIIYPGGRWRGVGLRQIVKLFW